MNSKKTLILAALAMSVGVGSAIAQETAGGVGAGPYETRELAKLTQILEAKAAATPHQQIQFGSSDHTNIVNWPVLQAADGNGG